VVLVFDRSDLFERLFEARYGKGRVHEFAGTDAHVQFDQV
jgi:hypothetical protein